MAETTRTVSGLDSVDLRALTPRTARRHQVRLFDEHASVVLAFATLLLGDVERAQTVARTVLQREIPLTATATPSWAARRRYALAVLAECELSAGEGAPVAWGSVTHLARAAVGLAIYGGFTYRQIAVELKLVESRSLELVRDGLLSLAVPS